MIRQATAQEREWYEKKLYPLQDDVLGALGDAPLILVGGTALARAYFHHRYSDDIDLFTPETDIRPLARGLTATWNALGFEVEPESANNSFARLWVVRKGIRLKVELANDIFIDAPIEWNGIKVASLRDLSANKVSAYEDRLAAKDIVDLYYLTRKIAWEKMFALAEQKRIPVAYNEFAQFSKTYVEGDALIVEAIPESTFLEFAEKLRWQTLEELKKKSLNYDPKTIVADLLWDAPPERRILDQASAPVIRRRLDRMNLPKRMAVERLLRVAML